MNHQSISAFIRAVANLLRGDYRQSEYGKAILPFTVLRRLDCVLETTKPAALTEHAADLLIERRSALISAAVTGKIDVRTFASSPI